MGGRLVTTCRNLILPRDESTFPFQDQLIELFDSLGLLGGFSEFSVIQETGDTCKCFKMLLIMAHGNKEKNDKFYGLIIKRVKIDALR